MFQADRVLFTYTPTEIVADASELGLKPGEWPDFITITDEEHQGYLLMRATPEVTQIGDIIYYRYYDRAGHLPVVKIIND